MIDRAICFLKDRFEQMHTVDAIFDFLSNQKNLLQEYEHNRLPSACQNFYETMGDINLPEINDELERFVMIKRKTIENLKTAHDFLTYI